MINVFKTKLSIEHPIIRGHSINLVNLLPGVAYIDMIFQLAEKGMKLDLSSVILRDLRIFHPLTIEESQVTKIAVQISEHGSDFKIVVADDKATNALTYATALLCNKSSKQKFAFENNRFAKNIDISALKKGASSKVDLDALYQRTERQGLSHRGMARAAGEIYSAAEHCLVKTSIDKQYRNDAYHNFYNAVLIDASVLALGAYATQREKENEKLYIPIHYEAFYAQKKIQLDCYAFLKKQSVYVADGIQKMDVGFYDSSGELIACLEGITAKEVRSESQLNFGNPVKSSSVAKFEIDTSSNANLSNKLDWLEVLVNVFSRYLPCQESEVDVNLAFFDMGLESAQLMALVKDFESIVQESLNPTLLFELNTIEELANYFRENFGDTILGEEKYTALETKVIGKNNKKLSLQDFEFEFEERERYLQDHKVFEKAALMGITHPCLVVEAFQSQQADFTPLCLEKIKFLGGPVFLEKNERVNLTVNFEEISDAGHRFSVKYIISGKNIARPGCEGELYPLSEEHKDNQQPIDIADLLSLSTPISQSAIESSYNIVADFKLGNMLKTIESAYQFSDDTFITRVDLADKRKKGNMQQTVFDPLLLNSCYYFYLDEKSDNTRKENIHIPLMIERLTIFQAMEDKAYVINTIRKKNKSYLAFDSMIINEAGERIARIENASIKEVLSADFPVDRSSNSSEQLNKAVGVEHTAAEFKIAASHNGDIAIIGLSGRYPQADDIDEFWQNLMNGKNCITEIPANRWRWQDYYSEDRKQTGVSYSKWGGFVNDFDRFDPLFFNIAPREAETMDPQERLFLQYSWLALEDAGYTREILKETCGSARIGVYAGVMSQEYPLFAAEAGVLGHRYGLGGGSSSIATRVSYYCDFHGPSMVIDTMCSSSLSAIYLACNALQAQSIDAAIAGGVNLILHPNKYLMLSQGQFISTSGCCESFGIGGNGYIPAEGVGALLLKRLTDAERDKDQIYAVIKGAAINHGGKASGYTAPNPKAQRQVITEAVQNAGIDPESITYIEAHGTGTKLGDPIEIKALDAAIGKIAGSKTICWIGSAKSNIGHCESAAGIAGITKLILQLKYKKICPSLHSSTLNPNIDFDSTRFCVNQTLRDWRNIKQDGEILPLRAGVSSFGAGGSNAHLVLEEYQPVNSHTFDAVSCDNSYFAILLSAKTSEALFDKARQLLAVLPKYSENDLSSIAYTLQLGREAMSARLAILTNSIKHLSDQLQMFLDKRSSEDFYFDNAKKNNASAVKVEDAIEINGHDKSRWLNLIKQWASGRQVDWHFLYKNKFKPDKVRLPLYPFAKEKYWVPDIKDNMEKRAKADVVQENKLHPFVHQNKSDITCCRFTSKFSGSEFIFNDHKVQGNAILPAVVYLEMIIAALSEAGFKTQKKSENIFLNNISWISIMQLSTKDVDIELAKKGGGGIEFKIKGRSAGKDKALYCRGNAGIERMPVMNLVDLPEIKQQCQKQYLSGDQCYAAYNSVGIQYGPAFRCISEIFVGDCIAFAKISVPEHMQEQQRLLNLPPGLLDSALQASIALIADTGASDDLYLPAELQKFFQINPCKMMMFAIVRLDQNSTEDKKLIDIDLVDESGLLCVKFIGLILKKVRPGVRVKNDLISKKMDSKTYHYHQHESFAGNVLLAPTWKTLPLHCENHHLLAGKKMVINNSSGEYNTLFSGWKDVYVIAPDVRWSVPQWQEALAGYGLFEHIIWLCRSITNLEELEESVLDEQGRHLLTCFNMVKALINLNYANRSLSWTLITENAYAITHSDYVAPMAAAVHGMLGSIINENFRWTLRSLDIAEALQESVADLIERLAPSENIVLRHGRFYQRVLVPVREILSQGKPLYRKNGVYVVIGGAGGVGEVWSEYMIKNFNAHIIWLGRKSLNEDIRQKLHGLKAYGSDVTYMKADAADEKTLELALKEIKTCYPRIHGVVHSAIVLKDSSMAGMKKGDLEISLAAKLGASIAMSKVFAKEGLDFVLFFSSLNALTHNAGQSNYVAGCNFQDAFAQLLRIHWSCPIKVVNWGYWGSVGVVANAKYREIMSRIGIGSLEAEPAMHMLQSLMASPMQQLVAINLKSSFHSDAVIKDEWLTIQSGQGQDNLRSLLSAFQFNHSFVQMAKRQKQNTEVRLNDMLTRLLWAQLTKAGMFKRTEFTFDEAVSDCKLHEHYIRWLRESLRILGHAKYLNYVHNCWQIANSAPDDVDQILQNWQQQRKLWLKDDSLKAQAILIHKTMHTLPIILSGKIRATDIMFPNSSMRMVEDIYQNNPIADFFNDSLAQIVASRIEQLVYAKDENKIKIMEVGAGTGGTSARIFPVLKKYEAYIEEYCYTDLSKAFLMHAEATYRSQAPYLKTQLFDISKPLKGQAIEAGAYHIIIATNVIHATPEICEALRNCKATLEAGGMMILNEMSTGSLFTHLTFGLLEGWWLYKDQALRIEGCPGLKPSSWKFALATEGFKDICFPLEDAHDLGQQIVVAISDGVVRQQSSMLGSEMLNVPQDKKKETSNSPATANADIASVPPNKTILSCNKIEKRIRKQKMVDNNKLLEDVVSAIRSCIAESLKIKMSRIDDEVSFADYGVDSIIAVNLINLINEKCNIILETTILFDFNNVNSLSTHIVEEYGDSVSLQLGEAHKDDSISNSYHAPSPLENALDDEEKHLSSTSVAGNAGGVEPLLNTSTPVSVQNRAGEPIPNGYYQRVIIDGPGNINNIRLVSSPTRSLKAHEVRISVRAFSINFGDLLCVRGLYPTMPAYPFTPGFEASGIIIETGSQVTIVDIGDEVVAGMGKEFGGHSNMIICHQNQVFTKPNNISFEHACALPTVTLTMIDAFSKARLQRGEKILIQTATGGTGLIAMQMAKHIGAEIYATAGSQEKLDYLNAMGAHHTINYQTDDFETEVKRLTHGRGVDVVINTLSGDAIQKGMNCVASGGRYIEIAMTALKSAKAIDMSVFSSNQTFYSIDLRKLSFEHPEKILEYKEEMNRLVEQGIVEPTVCRIFPLKQVLDAYKFMENRRNIGKIVVTIPIEDQYNLAQTDYSSVVVDADADLPAVQRKPIAIVGMSGRFPKSKNLNEFWQNLAEGNNLVDKVNRWPLESLYKDGDDESISRCIWGGFLDDIDKFDPLFFNISGREATYMDPQQRLFLQEAWKALEDAGYAGSAIDGSQCGVYVGACSGDYQSLFAGEQAPAQAYWGNHSSIISSRIAYYMNLQGPAVTLDTSCSSSLVAIHMACQALWSGEIDYGLAGGAFVQSSPAFYKLSNRAGMMSNTGKCHVFDQSADGFVPGEAVAVVVLKRLDDALHDRDNIHAVIKGIGIGQDGLTNGITAPSSKSQERLLRRVYQSFNINPEDIGMVEAHGTGTVLGDPIEFTGLTRAFSTFTENKRCCAIGSVKSNMGHAAAAAGMAGVLKSVLALKYKKIPASLHFQNGNKSIDFENSPFFVNTELRAWDVKSGKSPLAAVSSFGFSGTNAHLVLAEAPAIQNRVLTPKDAYMVALSARTSEQLKDVVVRILDFCRSDQTIDCGNLSFTLMSGRKHLSCRLALVVHDIDELITGLQHWLEDDVLDYVLVANDQAGGRLSKSMLAYGKHCLEELTQPLSKKEYYEKLITVADFYVQQIKLDYTKLFEGNYFRISLPVYPFAEQSLWVCPNTSSNAAHGKPDAVADNSLKIADIVVNDRYEKSHPALNLTEREDQKFKSSENTTPRKGIKLKALDEYSASKAAMNMSSEKPKVEALVKEKSSLDMSQHLSGKETANSGRVLPVSSESIQKEITEQFASVLYIKTDDIAPGTSFMDLGIDSIIGIELMQWINKRFSTKIEAIKLYEYPCIEEFTEFLMSQMQADAKIKVQADSFKYGGVQQATQSTKPDLQGGKDLNKKAASTLQEKNVVLADIQLVLCSNLAELLYISTDEIGAETPFMDLGMDSIIGVEWIQRINRIYGLDLDATQVHKKPSIKALSLHIASKVAVKDAKTSSEGSQSQIDVENKTDEDKSQQVRYVHLSNIESKIDNAETRRENVRVVKLVPANIRSQSAQGTVSQGIKKLPTKWAQFPELIYLNQGSQGRPIFWLHPMLGGVEAYQLLVQKIDRPFFGIQARGWLTDRAPLEGVQSMASYYAHIIKTVQPDGPYDLGGYSLGGMLAYEITRQLQELGDQVASIVMLDSFDSNVAELIAIPDEFFNKYFTYQVVNMALFLPNISEPNEMKKYLIHRDELDMSLDDDAFFDHLLELAATKEKGLGKKATKIKQLTRKSIAVQKAVKVDEYKIEPLPNPDQVKCFYYRNKRGVFMGDLEPYFIVPGVEYSVDHLNYWSLWQTNLPNMQIIDVDVSNHMLLLSEEKACDLIRKHVTAIYKTGDPDNEELRRLLNCGDIESTKTDQANKKRKKQEVSVKVLPE